MNVIEMRSLGEICTFMPNSKRRSSYGNIINGTIPEGEFPFYATASKIKSSPIADYSELCLIIRRIGNVEIKMDMNFSCSDHYFIMKADDDILTKYIYYYLREHTEQLQFKFHGSYIKCISKLELKSIEIPIPSIAQQIEIVSNCYNNDLLIAQLDANIETIKLNTKAFF
jgi:restriction endonuclease S subunit